MEGRTGIAPPLNFIESNPLPTLPELGDGEG